MKLFDILQVKGSHVYTISPDASLAKVVATLVERNCGSLVAVQDGHMVGIITERDILRALSKEDKPLEELCVRDCMTRRVIVGHPHDDVSDIMGLMTSNRVRHLPIMDEGQLAGLISIGDVVKAHHDELQVENHYLMTYIQS